MTSPSHGSAPALRSSTPGLRLADPSLPPSPRVSPRGTSNEKNVSVVDWGTVSAMLLNFCSSISLVVVNKMVMDHHHFRFAVTLTCFHLCCTFILLLFTARLGVFEIKRLPLKDVSKLAAGTMGFICLTNLSLQHNSVGFYQVMKVMTTPTVVVIESLLYQKYLDTPLKIALIPVCLGVIVTTVTDFRLNAIGAAYATAGVIVTSFYQIWSGTLQKSLDCNALQLQTYVSPLAALFILPFIPIFDNYSLADLDSIWFYTFNPVNTGLILITGLFGFLVNVSIFLVIGRSSPVSYNVLGHGKTVFVLGSDFMFFGRPFNFQSTIGIVFTMLGVFWYTKVKLQKARLEAEARSRTEEKLAEVKAVHESDEEPLLLVKRAGHD